MALGPQRLRKLFAAGAALAVLVAAFFYLRGILKSNPIIGKLPKSMPADIEKSGKGFTFSQSEGGKTLFVIRAASFQQYKDGGRAQLHDVSIIVYGREENRSDQIYGSDFSYDQKTGDITAEGEVQIDLDATSGSVQPNLPPPQESKRLIHVKTSGLTFNKATGLAHTEQEIEFRVPEMSGSAVGALYDSHKNLLTLKSAVRIVTTDKNRATITGQSASITKAPRAIVLHSAKIEQPPRVMTTQKLTLTLRDDNSLERVNGSGGVHASASGPKGFDVSAAEGELLVTGANKPGSGTLAGGVNFETRGDAPAQGKAGRVLLSFGPGGQITQARLEDAVDLNQGTPGKSQRIQAAALDLFLRNGKKLEKAVTSNGPAQIVLTQGMPRPTTTTVSAGQFQATFNSQNRLRSIFGSPDAKIVSSTPGQPDRVAASRDLTAEFNSKGEIASAELNGNFHYEEGQRTATADYARYSPATESFVLKGSPRVVDSGLTLTADNVQINRKTGSATAEGQVKTTYNDLKAQPNGAMLASGEPVHVTGATATANRGAEVAHYTAARLWQGQNIVEAPSLTFNKSNRSLLALGDRTRRVTSVFVSPQKNGAGLPVTVTADRLSYVDSDRKAVFSGNVRLRGDDFTMDANTVQVLLHQRVPQAGNQGASQLDRIVAQGDIVIQQPNRKATGSQLVYTAQEQKFVLTGSPGRRPSIFDAEHGQISGDSLTFYTHDGRVLVGSGEASTPQAQSRIRDAGAK